MSMQSPVRAGASFIKLGHTLKPASMTSRNETEIAMDQRAKSFIGPGSLVIELLFERELHLAPPLHGGVQRNR